MRRAARRLLAAGLLASLHAWALLGCRSAGTPPPPRAPDLGPPPALDTLVPGPRIRVGVRTGFERTSVAADPAVSVWPLDGGVPVRLTRASFVAERSPGSGAAFEVQVANVSREGAAREVAGRAGAVVGRKGFWRAAGDGVGLRVRVGPWSSREEAEAGLQALRAAGFPDAWIATAPAAPGTGLRLLETGTALARALVVPVRPGAPVEIDGALYRGVVEVVPDPAGGLAAVNVLPLEEYLRGVVPRELPPEAFPELEALKAQAVAARSYALRNLGRFADAGYDVCATPACQVYGGLAAEQELSDRAVAETRSLVALREGAIVDTLYTSTCGGHTEDVENVFPERAPEPHLRGVACAPERALWGELTSRGPASPSTDADAALLAALGVAAEAETAAPESPATAAELELWTARLVQVAGRRACVGPPGPDLRRRGAFFAHLVSALCWGERRLLLAPGDVEYLLPAGETWPAGEAAAAAVLLDAGVLSPGPSGLRPEAPVTRGEAVALLAAAARALAPVAYRETLFRQAGGGRIAVARDAGVESLPLDEGVKLVRLDGARARRVEELRLVPGDAVRLVERAGRVVYLEALAERSAAWDRSSRYQRWEVRATPAELAATAAAAGWRGPLEDVRPRRRGVSGRVVELDLVGPDATRTLRGLEVRRALGLRETLFTVERERDASGAVRRFVFSGRGWGHGVGLCQVGAYGMARAGARFDEILRHYYTGIALGPGY